MQYNISTIGRSADVTANTKCKGRYTFIKFKASAVCFTDPLTTGRYVGIKTTKSQALQLCEVEIYSRGNSTNIDNKCDKDVYMYMVELPSSDQAVQRKSLLSSFFTCCSVYKLVKREQDQYYPTWTEEACSMKYCGYYTTALLNLGR